MARVGSWILGFMVALSLSPAAAAAAEALPILRGAPGQFTLLRPVRLAPTTAIRGLDGTVTDLGRYRGRVVVLNFWATWCLPCRHEMPALDRLAAASDRDRVAVVAVSIDRPGAEVAPFIAARKLAHLAVYLDPEERLGALGADHVRTGALPLWALPISYVIDKEGRVVGYLSGAAEWDSAAARRFLDYLVTQY